jgi:hypothetical protein
MSPKVPLGKPVEVIGIGQRQEGILISISETEVYLRTPTRRLALPLESVKDIIPLDEKRAHRLLKLLGLKKEIPQL